MRALAEFVMRGRMQATLVVVAAAVLQPFFWLGAAAGSLVLLRRGTGDAIGILAWALLPALAWWYLGDPTVTLVMLGSAVLAQVLRSSMSWNRVMLASVVLGVFYVLLLSTVSAGLVQGLAEAFGKVLPQVLSEAKLSADQQAELQAGLVPAVTGLLAASLQVISLLCLMLARYWQAALYNPQGFGREFRALRLAPAVAIALLLGVLVVPLLGPQFAVVAPLCAVPLLFAGLALGHGLVALKRLPGFWLVLLYGLALMLGNVICLVAVVDSLFDFRGRLVRRQGSTNGEG
ncbi:hypothetical protein CW310_05235 [Pseudomonas citronellolis]|jgi:hypothetical protein|uniref:DUF2232 domain-containing protein n=2 Tax=Pseudomonas citronellolis TaxID=53408 RepID=A0A127N0J7_9PSED|nr:MULTISPECIES: hypothetical protein [Pseudomonas]AMO79053.1 hypothetical protein PcP3B5_56870 [Pseudomonas citronellolis]ANI17756.1 hypothetical protein A9C11_28865 [Pseudomonas citronellolis]KRV71649.1 hypothetical protein AO742_04965 [Pseudomonas citronellolis]KRW76861.1 hypothetical protein AO738_00650 [Pseudomonas citronellolis]MCP1604822.1 hypothetical protein [Pseudomonas citronellolis]